jgi:hypothetical protein
MIIIFTGEHRNGRMKFTTDRDCLSPDIIRFGERYFPDMQAMIDAAMAYEKRGFNVCIDTEDYFYETGDEPRLLKLT